MIDVALLQILFILVPMLCIAYWKKSYYSLQTIFIFFAALISTQLTFALSSYLDLFYWNWEGKILETLWPLLVVYLLKWMSPEEVGYRLPQFNSGWLWGGILGLFIAIIAFFIDIVIGSVNDQNLSLKKPIIETLAFQLTMPGLAEESVYRGIFLAIFNRYYIRSWKIFNVQIGWGLILTTLLFTSTHVVSYSLEKNAIIGDFSLALPVFIFGFIFGWLREKTGSLWPCVLCHNFANTLYQIGGHGLFH